jgi:uncharacterized protein
MEIIDADAHVRESEQVWKFLDRIKYPVPPVPLTVGRKRSGYWALNGKIFPKPMGKGAIIRDEEDGRSELDVSLGGSEMTDVESRLRDMDECQVAAQVIYPTLFLSWMTDEEDLEVALCRSYNRFMAEACAKAPQRLRWAAIPPLRNIGESINEMRFAREKGAVAIFMRGMEGSRTLDDPYFFPVYEAAMKLGLVVAVHVGRGCPEMANLFDVKRNTNLGRIRILPLLAFNDIVWNAIPEKFPGLKFAFLEACSQWVPYLLNELNRRRVARGMKAFVAPNLFRDYRLYVSYEVDEDLSLVVKYVGEDNVVIGSDYGHHGASAVKDYVSRFIARNDVSAKVIEKILGQNSRDLYGL